MSEFKYKNIFSEITFKFSWKAAIILIISLFLTLLASLYTHREVAKQEKADYLDVCKDIELKISLRMQAHAQLLQTAATFIEASDSVTRAEWKIFNTHADINAHLQGSQGIGYSVIVPKVQLNKHIETIRNEGFPEYSIKPLDDRTIYTSIIYIEPFSGRNLRAFGYDMFSESVRRKAMQLACDLKSPVLSGKVTLVQETDKDVQVGTLMYMPVYKRGMSITNVAQRRRAIKGWAYSPYRMNDLMQGVLGRWDVDKKDRIHLQIFDDTISAKSLLFDSQHNELGIHNDSPVRTVYIPAHFNEKKWVLMYTQSEDQLIFFHNNVIIVFISCLVISLLLFFLSLSLFNTQHRANLIAEKLIAGLKENEERFKNIFVLHSSIMLLVEPESGEILDANHAASEFYGYSIAELCKKTINELNTLSAEQIVLERQNAIASKRNYFVFPHQIASGETRFVEVHSTPIDYADKKLLFSVIHDITERIVMEQALKESEEKLRFAFEFSAVGICMLDMQGRFQWVNNAFTTMLGYTLDDVLNVQVAKITFADDVEAGNTILRKMVAGEITSANFEKRYISKTSVLVWAAVIATVISGKNNVPFIIVQISDISERKKAEEALKESKEKLKAENERFVAVMNSMDSSVYVSDFETYEILFANKCLTDIFGDIIGKKCYSTLQKNQTTPCSFCTNDILLDKNRNISEPYIWEFQNTINKNWYQVHDSKISWSDGRPVRLEIAIDISELKKTEALIEQTRINYETFFNTINDFLFVLDAQGNIIHTNSTVNKRLEYTPEELFGQSVLLVHPPERRAEAGRIVGEMLAGTADFCPVPIVTKSGNQIAVETRVTAGQWNGQNVIFGVTKDISEIKLSEEKFSKAFHSNSALMALSHLKDGVFIDVNESFLKELGYKSEEVIGKSAIELNLFVDKSVRVQVTDSLIDSNSRKEVEMEVRTKTGTIKYGLFSAEKIYIGSEPCLLTTMIDITYRKEAELIIKQQNEQLSQLNLTKDMFFSIIAHDLKNPFATLLSSSELLSLYLDKNNMDKVRTKAQMIFNASKQGYVLLENLLEWAQSQLGRIKFAPTRIQLFNQVNEIMNLLEIQASDKGIEIYNEIPENLCITADISLLQFIIRNLITNAIKFTPQNGTITIKAEKNEAETVISVKDTGVGMSEDIVQKLFRIDSKITSKGTAGESGTGLGLILCKEFVEKHGGKIWAESELSKGSEFKFTIPVNEP